MMDIQSLMPVVNALGWMLIHFLWQGCAIAAMYWLVCWLTPRRSPVMHYWAGMIGYLCCALAPLVTFLLYLKPAVVADQAYALTLPALNVASAYPVSTGSLLAGSLESIMPTIVALWIVGVTLMSTRTLFGWFGVRALVRQGAEAVNEEIASLALQLAKRLGVRRTVTVLRSTRVAVPTVVGWLKPVMLLPAGVLARLPHEQLSMVIAHELSHVRRNDYLFNFLQLFIETLFFYHPAIGWLGNKVRAEREHCCDDEVVSALGQPVVYARALASLEHLRAPAAPALTATGGDLFYRVNRIVQREMPKRHSGFSQLAVLVGLAAVASVSVKQGIEIGADRVGLDSIIEAPLISEVTSLQAVRTGALGQGLRQFGVNQREREEQRAAEQQSSSSATAFNASVNQLPAISVEQTSRQLGASVSRTDPAVNTAIVTPSEKTFVEKTLSNDEPDAYLPVSNRGQLTPDISFSRPVEYSSAIAVEQNKSAQTLDVRSESAVSSIKPLPAPRARMVLQSIDVVHQVEPEYPYRAFRDAVEGQVRLQFTVDPETGRPRNINVVNAYPEGVFDSAATKAISKWRFEVQLGLPENLVLYQVFDFTQAEAGRNSPNGQRVRRCNRTGGNICGRHFSDENVKRYGS